MRADNSSTPVRGREPELAVIDRRVSAVGTGEGGVLVLDGPAGIGKSRLSTEVIDRARRREVRVLRAEAVRGWAAPFGPLLAATLGVDPPLGDAQTLRALSERAGAAYWVLHDLRAVLLAAAAESPLVIVIDDLQWADTDTAMAIRTLVSDLRHLGVLWVLAARRDQAGPVVGDLLTHLEADGAETVRLGPLSLPASSTMVEDIVHAEAEVPLLEMVGGVDGHTNPYWLTELLRGLHEEGRLHIAHGRATVAGSGLPHRIIAAMSEWLQELSAPTRRVVRMAALLPTGFTATQLADLVRCRPSDLIEPLDDAVRAGLLTVDGRGVRFGQDLLRQATLETLSPSLRRSLERESADVLLRTGADPAEVASMLARTAETGDRAAIATLRTAAETIAKADPGTAADLTLRTLELLPPDDADRGPLVVSALTNLHRAARTVEAGSVAARSIAELLPAQQEAAVRLCRSTAVARPAAERIQDNRAALALRGVTPHARAEHRGWLAWNLMGNGDLVQAERQARDALADAVEVQDSGLSATSRLVLATVYCARGDGTAAAAELDLAAALVPGSPDPYAPMRDLQTANLLHCLGRTTEATTALTGALRRVRRDHDLPLLGIATQFSAMSATTAGRLTAARTELESPGLMTAGDGPATLAAALHMITSAALAMHLGDASLARAAASAAQKLRTSESTLGRRWARRVLAAAALNRGDVMHAARLLTDDPLLPAGPPLPVDVANLIMVSRVADAAGDRSLADRVAAAAAGLVGAPAFTAGAEHVHGVIDNDPDRLLTAAELHTAAGRPLLSALATQDAGSALLRRGRNTDAVARLNTAFDMFAAAGAIGDAQRVRSSLRAQGTTRRLTGDQSGDGWASLTFSELRVVRLIAAGATNRTAARELFISPHTVSTHVRSVFAKLGITSRVQLANALRDNGG